MRTHNIQTNLAKVGCYLYQLLNNRLPVTEITTVVTRPPHLVDHLTGFTCIPANLFITLKYSVSPYSGSLVDTKPRIPDKALFGVRGNGLPHTPEPRTPDKMSSIRDFPRTPISLLGIRGSGVRGNICPVCETIFWPFRIPDVRCTRSNCIPEPVSC